MTAFAHQALVYGTDEEFLAGTAAFLRSGATRGEPAVVVTTPRNISLLRREPDLTQANIEYIDAATWYIAPGPTLGAFYDRVRQHQGPGMLWVIGEPVWAGRTARQVTEWQRYESVFSTAFSGTSSRVLCPYDVRVVPAGIVSGAAATHPAIGIRGAPVALSPAYRDPLEYSAACDRDPLPAPSGQVSEYPVGRGSLRKVRAFARSQAAGLGLSGDRLADLLTAVNEAAANVLAHGGGSGSIAIWADGDDIVCDVVDQAGRLTDPLAGYRPPGPNATRGLGLWMTRQLCDLVEIRTSAAGTVVRLRIRRDAAYSPSA